VPAVEPPEPFRTAVRQYAVRARTKGPDELDRWLERWYEPAFRTAYLVLDRRDDAEEVVRQAFLRLWRFRESMPEGDALGPWVYRAVVSACSSLATGEPGRSDECVGEAPAGGAVLGALSRLPVDLRVPVVLSHYAGLSEREIAVAVRRRAGTVRARLEEGRRRLCADPRIAGLSESERGAR